MTRPTGKRKRRTIVEEEIPEGQGLDGEESASELDVSLEQVQDLETLNSVLEQYGLSEGVLFKIYKIVDGIQRYVFEHPTLDEAFIQRERGGGNYVARLFINGKFKRPIPFAIEELPDSAKSNGNGSSNGHQAFLEKMILALIAKDSGSHAGTPSVTELTQALANLDGLRGKQESAVDLVIKGMNIAKDFGDNGGPGDWKSEMLKLAKDNAPGVLGTLQQLLAQRNGTPAPGVPGVPVNVPVVPNPPVQNEDEELALMLKYAIGHLKSQFMMGLDGESALGLILANSNNPTYQPVIRKFAVMDFEELVQLDAEIGKEPFITRFRFVHDGLRSAIREADTMDDDTSGGPGNVVDLGRDGKSSAGGKR